MNETALRDQLSVKTICQLTGINGHTLRAWERRYHVVQPRRLDNGRRTYSIHDLEKLKLVALLIRKGFLIGNIAHYPVHELNSLLNEAAQTTTMQDPVADARDRSQALAQRLERAVSTYDLTRLSPLLSQAKADYSIRAYLFELLIPLLQRVGNAVACDELSVGQEHALSAVVRYHLMQSLFQLTDHYPLVHAQEAPKSFALTTMEGNQHELGTLMAAILCAYHGYRIFYLGVNMPALALVDTVRALGATGVILGLSPGEGRLPEIRSYLDELVPVLPQVCELWTGGNNFYFDKKWNDRVKNLGTLDELDQLLERLPRSDT